MNQPQRSAPAGGLEPGTPDPVALVADSAALMGGRRELIIRHGADTYRLRVTASNKLILTK
jgi:hemin uptake protein HemP